MAGSVPCYDLSIVSSSTSFIGWLLLGWLAYHLVILGLLVWFWRWLLKRGQAALPFVRSAWNKIQQSVMRQPLVHAWLNRHPRFTRFAHDRFSLQRFTGLPLTLLALAFLYMVSLLLGIVQDYLFGDPLIAADLRIANLLYAFREPRSLRIFYIITLFGESGVIIAVALFLSVLLWQGRQRLLVFSLWLTLMVSEGATFLGKLLFHRARPDLLLRAVAEDSFSFPSGHATTAAAFYGFLAYLVIRTNTKWGVKVHAVFTAMIAVVLIDVSRLYLGVHYVSDVLAGDLVGVAGLLFSISVTEWLVSVTRHAPLAFPVWKLGLVCAAPLLIVLGILTVAPSPWVQTEPPAQKHVATGAVPSLFEHGELPRFTETIIGTTQEPTNVMLVASERCLIATFQKAHWQLADALSLRSAQKAIEAALFNREYAMAPMTPSFYDTRPHDLGFEKETAQQTIRARHHARFWHTHYETESGSLFVGTVSLDTGIKWGITHQIAPDIDTERTLTVSDLKQTGLIAHEQDVPLIVPTLGKNFTGDEFFTDGKATFLILKCSRY